MTDQDVIVVDGSGEPNGDRVDRNVRGQIQRLPCAHIEHRAMPRTLHGTGLGIDLTFEQVAVVVRAAVFDGDEVAIAVEHADLEVLPLDEPMLAGQEFLNCADVNHGAQNASISDFSSRSYSLAPVVPGDQP